MDKRRGGCAPNIAYTLALLGERPRLMATAGQDFGEYRHWLELAGVDTSLVIDVPGKFTASFFCSTDTDNNQIASFYTGAMANASELSFRDGRRVTWRSSRRTIRKRCCNTPRSAARWRCRSSSIRGSSARGCRAELGTAWRERRGDLQRLRVRDDPPEDGT